MTVAISRRFDPYIAGAIATLLYLATRSRNYSGDAFGFTVTSERAPFWDAVESHQILTSIIAWSSYRLPKLFGWSGGAIEPLQIVNALAGGACVGLMYATAASLTESRRIAALAAAGFAVSGAPWLLSSDAEFVMVPLAFGAAALLLAVRAARPDHSIREAVAAGALTGLAILASLPNAAAGLAFGAALAIDRKNGSDYIRRSAAFSLAALVMALPVYLLVAGSSVFAPHPGSAWYGRLALGDVTHGAYAFLRSLVLAPGLSMGDHTALFLRAANRVERLAFGLRYVVSALIAATPFVVLIIARRRGALRRGDPLLLPLVAIIAWSASHALFAIWWVQGDISFWVPVTFGWWLIAAFAIRPILAPGRSSVGLGAICGLIGFLAIGNASAVILPNRSLERNVTRSVVATLLERTSPEDLVLTSREPGLSMYLTLMGPRTSLSADQLMFADPEFRDDFEAHLRTEIERAEEQGGDVWLVELAPAGLARWRTSPAPIWDEDTFRAFEFEQWRASKAYQKPRCGDVAVPSDRNGLEPQRHSIDRSAISPSQSA